MALNAGEMSVLGEIHRVSELLTPTRGFERAGYNDRRLAAAVRARQLTRIRPGWYMPSGFWDAAAPATRHLTAILAAHLAADTPPLFSHRSAAVLHGLPVLPFGQMRVDFPPAHYLVAGRTGPRTRLAPRPHQVHVTVSPDSTGNSNRSVLRHQASVGFHERAEVGGLSCTSTERTLLDVARTEPFAIALACGDALLRDRFRSSRHLPDELAVASTLAAWRRQLLVASAPWAQRAGAVAVRALARLADPRADSPLESVSRLRFLQLGFDAELQVRVRSGHRRGFSLDFLLPGLGVWGECDGRVKYTDAALRAGRSAAEVVYDEKRRQDWIEGTTGLRCIRWGAAEVASPELFAEHLRAHGLCVPGRPVTTYGAETAEFLARLP